MTDENEQSSFDLDGEAELRIATAKVMSEMYLSEDLEVVEKCLERVADAHDFTHYAMHQDEGQILAAIVKLDFAEVAEIKHRATVMSDLHIAIEHLHLIMLDHRRRLKGETPLGDTLPPESAEQAPASEQEPRPLADVIRDLIHEKQSKIKAGMSLESNKQAWAAVDQAKQDLIEMLDLKVGDLVRTPFCLSHGYGHEVLEIRSPSEIVIDNDGIRATHSVEELFPTTIAKEASDD